MNKIIFQIGLLAFCVASVVFMTQDMDVMGAIARAFIVFIVVVSSLAVLLFVASSFATRRERPADAMMEPQSHDLPGTGTVVNQTDAHETAA